MHSPQFRRTEYACNFARARPERPRRSRLFTHVRNQSVAVSQTSCDAPKAPADATNSAAISTARHRDIPASEIPIGSLAPVVPNTRTYCAIPSRGGDKLTC